jgi:hypothetical protein
MARLFVLVFAALIVLFMPATAAQAPGASLVIDGGPSGDVVSMKGVTIVSLNVTLQVSGVVCTSAGAFAVDLLGAADQEIDESDENATEANATVNVTPSALSFTHGAGPYGNNPGLPAAQPYDATQTIAVSVESGGLPNETTYGVTITAKLRPASTSDCRGTAALPETSAQESFRVTFNETESVLPTSPELPVPWFLGPVALIAVVALRRRL